MNEFKNGTLIWKAPSSFDELTPLQLKQWAMMTTMLGHDDEPLPNAALRAIAARKFSGIPLFNYLQFNKIQQMSIEDTFEFLFQEFTMNDWKVNITGLYGPGERMKFLTVEQFSKADGHFNKFVNTKNEDEIVNLSSVLMRPGSGRMDKNGDYREPFSIESFEKAKKIHAKQYPSVRIALQLNYIGIRALMVVKNPNVFSKKNQDKATSGGGWPAVIYEMAGDKAGPISAVEQMPIWNLLYIAELNEIKRLKEETNGQN